MRTLLLCASFICLVETAFSDTFWPTPIPLFDWHETRRGRAGTLQEIITAAPPTVAAIPAHYWEDALRHSVYLTLVRDKIDQLIAKGDIRPETVDPQIDEHYLWDKIKNAPFDRLESDKPAFGDDTVMAKGRLLEQNDGFRFTEDERSKSNCSEPTCDEGVKAFWSVRRVRQGDVGTSPGKYHYELTFSVTTEPYKQGRKSYETPVRTFTLQENSEKRKKYFHNSDNFHTTPSNERSLWVHKNIVPTTPRYFKHRVGGVDRIFSSLFEGDTDERPLRNNLHPFMHTQNSKMSLASTSRKHQLPKLIPYPYKPQSFKYFHPPSPTQSYSYVPQYQFDLDSYQTTEYRYVTPSKIPKTYKPFLPTLPPPIPLAIPPKNATDAIMKKAFNTDYVNSTLETLTPFNPKFKPLNVNYFTETIRPPIFSVPPSMILGLDKNTFKPMPPLKLGPSTKVHKSNKPLDFKPSPQILDIDPSKPNSYDDTEFRPITLKYEDLSSTVTLGNIEIAEKKPNPNRGSLRRTTKQSKNIKQEYTTVPEIITANSIAIEENEEDPMGLASILSALVKTTPMVSQTETTEDYVTESYLKTATSITQTTVPITSSTLPSTTTEAAKETTTSTTPMPTKRTRPPPKFIKPEKPKKHKRLSTTTHAPNKIKKYNTDLTPQASSIIVTTKKPVKEKNSDIQATTQSISSTISTTSSTTPQTTTSTRAITETHSTRASTSTPILSTTTERYKNKNRFRQSTLMYKGTSVKHDKWSLNSNVSDKVRTILPTGIYSPRRKASNFIWSLKSSTQPSTEKEHDENDYEDQTLNVSSVSSTEATSGAPLEKFTVPTTSSVDMTDDHDGYKNQTESTRNTKEASVSEVEIENFDKIELKEPNNKNYDVLAPNSNEGSEEVIEKITPEKIIITSPSSTFKNNKCKKKRKQNIATTEGSLAATELESDELLSAKSTNSTETNVTPDMFEEIFGSFTFDEESTTSKRTPSKSDLNESESENHERYEKSDSLEDLIDSLEKGEDEINDELYDNNESAHPGNESYDIDDDDDISKDSNKENYREHPYSLLELMTMA